MSTTTITFRPFWPKQGSYMASKKEKKAKTPKVAKPARVRTLDGLVTYPIRLTEEQWLAVDGLAKEQGLSIATVVRSAVAQFAGTSDPTIKRGKAVAA